MRLLAVSIRRNLIAGSRLALFMPVRAFDYRVSANDYAVLVAVNFVVWVAAAYVRVGFEGEFDGSALYIYLASIPLVLAAALVVARIFGAPERLLLIATALSASYAVYELAGLALAAVAE